MEEIDAVTMTDIMPNENDILENEVLIPRRIVKHQVTQNHQWEVFFP